VSISGAFNGSLIITLFIMNAENGVPSKTDWPTITCRHGEGYAKLERQHIASTGITAR